MMRLPLRSFSWFLILLVAGLLAACGSVEPPPDGDKENDCPDACDAGLECVGGECICVEIGCCLSSADCMAGETCDKDLHQCKESTVDGDTDVIDGDSPTDGDDVDGDDVDSDLDGDTPDGDLPDGDLDDDLDDDSTDGDVTDNDTSLECMWGVDKLLHPENLPFFENQVVTKQFSSRDPQEGNTNNDDTRTNYLYLGGGSENVLLDSRVPGCLYRVWMGMQTSTSDDVANMRIKFYFDDETNPSVNMLVKNFFAADTGSDPVSPFLRQLAGTVSESYYNYVPICWAENVKMTISGGSSGITAGWQVTFQEMPACTNIETFSFDMDVSELVTAVTDNLGQDPKPTQGNVPTTYNTQVAAGSIITLFEDPPSETSVGKSINSFKMDIAGVNEDILNNAWIEIFWDGKDVLSEPDVEAPIGLFFGSGFGEIDWSGVMMGMSTTGSYYSYWPMPYWKSAIIRINNRSQSNIQQLNIELQIGENNYPKNEVGHFRAVYNEEIPTSSDIDYTALDLGGKGRVVGIHMAMQHIETNTYIAGDERFYIDGMQFPTIRGTGTDNFFNGNMLWRNGPYSKPWFSIFKETASGDGYKYVGRRIMLGDSISFNQSISLGFEHGKINKDNANYRSVVFLYSSCIEGMQLSDEVCLGKVDLVDPCAENNHNFDINPSDGLTFANVTGAYEGEYYLATTPDSGRGIQSPIGGQGYMQMVVAINPENQGVRLVRKYSYKTASSTLVGSPQVATVLVGNPDFTGQLTPVGTWVNPEQNTQLSWAESVFDIPAAYTAGKSSIGITFEHAGGSQWWNMFHLWVYSILPPGDEGEGPGKVESLDYQMVGLKPCLSWNEPPGVPPTIYHIYRSSAQAFSCEQEYVVGSTSDTEWCEPEALDAQTTYYYRVIGEDCTGMRGPCSDRFEIETGVPPTCYEAEDTFDSVQSTEGITYQERTGTEFSGNKLFEFLSTAPGNRANFILDVESTADFMIEVTFLKGPSMATIDFRVGGGTFSGTTNIDLYSATEELTTMSFGPRSIETGEKNFTFIVGVLDVQNPASGGKHIAIDKICLMGAGSKKKAK